MDDLPLLEGSGDEGIKGTCISNFEDTIVNSIEGEKASVLRRLLKEQFNCCDLLWGLFRASSESYKFDSLLRPFPKMYINDVGDKMIDNLRLTAGTTASLSDISKQLEDNSISKELINLLFWVLVESHSFNLTVVDKSDFSDVLNKVKNSDFLCPHYMFEVDHSARASSKKFKELRENYGVCFAFHGSRLENFFSILNHGLQVSLNKVAAFGPGVYLSSNLNVSLMYSQAGITWSDSRLGSALSVVALCEMIDHPDVKCQDDKLSARKYAEGNRSSEVPKQYFIVQNSDLVRVKYLLVYKMPNSTVNQSRWTLYGSVPFIIIAYLFLLLIIKLYNSPYVFRKINQFLSHFY